MSQTMQLLCSTGAFSRYPDYTQYEAILEYGPQLEVDGFELLFYPGWYPHLAQIADDLRHSGLKFPVVHTEKKIGIAFGNAQRAEREQGVRWLAENCWLGKQVGAQVLVLHLWGPPESDDNLDNNLEQFHQCLDIAAQYDIELAVETIPCRHFDPLSNTRRAVERDSRCRIAFDTEFLAKHEQIETAFTADWLWQGPQGPLVRHVHIKDYNGQGFNDDGTRRYLHPGEGHIDFTTFFANLKSRNVSSFISLESPAINPEGQVNITRLNASLANVRAMMQV